MRDRHLPSSKLQSNKYSILFIGKKVQPLASVSFGEGSLVDKTWGDPTVARTRTGGFLRFGFIVVMILARPKLEVNQSAVPASMESSVVYNG